jgi:uncharacterized membrane protein YhaH (DUF805 family)
MEDMFRPIYKYADFHGRASRNEYWMFQAFLLIVGFVFSILDTIVSHFTTVDQGGFDFISTLHGLFNLIVFIPSMAVTFRRLHDTNKSGKLLFLYLIPFMMCVIGLIMGWHRLITNDFGFNPLPILADPLHYLGSLIWVFAGLIVAFIISVVFFIFTCLKGTEGPNQYLHKEGEYTTGRNDI